MTSLNVLFVCVKRGKHDCDKCIVQYFDNREKRMMCALISKNKYFIENALLDYNVKKRH